LGALGFLSTGDENSPGNYGILDQMMALRWVYDNVEYFNGDKNLITLFGPDAGRIPIFPMYSDKFRDIFL
jgi:carboxylesterase type B